MSNERGRLIIVSGPTASGKSTLWRRLVQREGVDFSVSATTRAPRTGEVDGHDYHFVSAEQFQTWIDAGAFLEWAEVHGKRYGTLREHVLQSIDGGNDIVLEIDVQGARQLNECDLPLFSLFVIAPSREILEQRLRDRGTETEEQIQRRLSIVDMEMSYAKDYQHQVVNDDFERMETEVEQLLGYNKEVH
jgi:guanylate kinase